MEVKRDIYLERLVNRMHNGMVKVVTGVRRCGKSYLLFTIFDNYLRQSGVEDDQIIAVPLDMLEYSDLRNPFALSEYLNSRLTSKTRQYYIFIDEVQYAIEDEEVRGGTPPRIYDVLNSLLRRQNVDVYVTGSNSRFLSSDIMTEFRGRGDEVRVHPLSFAEFMQVFDGDRYQGWSEYTLYGGMPLVASMRFEEQKVRYLENLFAETYMKDIIARNKLRKTQEFEQLTDVVASSIGSLTSPSKLEATFKSVTHSSVSANTIALYLGYLEEAFLIEEAQRFDVKGRKYIGSPKKYYFEDVGLRNARLSFRQVEEAHLMENILYNELRIRGYSVDVGVVEDRRVEGGKEKRSRLEVDFVANLGSQRFYIQSALHLPDEQKMRQEKASLERIDDSFRKIILVRDVVKPTRDERGIEVMDVYDFLLNPASLVV